MREPADRIVSERERPTEALGETSREMARERRDVVLAIAQGRQLDHDDIDAIEQILAKPAGAHLGLEIARGGNQHARVHAARLLIAYAPDLTLLQHPQQLCLQADRQLADLVEQERAAARLLEQPGFVAGRPGERAAHVTEQLGLEQGLGDRRAVDADEGFARARAGAMNGARDHFLAGAALTGDEHRRVVLGDPRDERQCPPHGRTLGDETALGGSRGQLRSEAGHFLPQSLPLLRLAQGEHDLVRAERLGEIVVRAFLHRGNRGVFAAVGAHHDDERIAAALAVGA